MLTDRQLLFRQQQVDSKYISVDGKESADDLATWFGSLPEKVRITLTLKYVNELKTGEIASILEIPQGTVKSRINKGLKLLKQTQEANDFLTIKGGDFIERNC